MGRDSAGSTSRPEAEEGSTVVPYFVLHEGVARTVRADPDQGSACPLERARARPCRLSQASASVCCSPLDKWKETVDLCCRFGASLILERVYGHTVTSDDDEYLHYADAAVIGTTQATTPGTAIVDFLPFCEFSLMGRRDHACKSPRYFLRCGSVPRPIVDAQRWFQA